MLFVGDDVDSDGDGNDIAVVMESVWAKLTSGNDVLILVITGWLVIVEANKKDTIPDLRIK